MTKFHKLTKKLIDDLNDGKYLSVVIGLQNPNITIPIYELPLRNASDISEDEIEGMGNVLKVSKALYELNQYMSGITYKLIPDSVYDVLIEKYKTLRNDDEPFQSFIPTGMRSTEQDFPELSGTLDKAYDIYDVGEKPSIEKWLRKISKETGKRKLHLTVAFKYDGTSITVTFDNINNKLNPVKAITRGDFENNKGVDLSNILVGRKKIEWAENILLPDKIGIQFEAIVTDSGREKLKDILGISYSTKRAATASVLKRISNPKTPKDELEKLNGCISLYPLITDGSVLERYLSNEKTFQDLLLDMNISTNYFDGKYTLHFLYGDINTILEGIKNLVPEITAERNKLPYTIDGLVLSVADEDVMRIMGRSSNKNKWQIAYKFDAMVQKTKITGIIPSMGKQGFIGSNITFDPIEFNGVQYDKAPVNNITRFNELDPRIGDDVLVSYNADVMGYIFKDATCKSNKNGERLYLPTKCIKCGSELIVTKDMMKCINDECPGHKVGRILEVIRILNLDYFGEETANDIVEKAGIFNAVEFIRMKYEDLAKVLKGLNLEKAWEEFQTKIKAPISYAKIIDLLRIPSLRTKTAEKILDEISIDDLIRMASKSEIDKLHARLKEVKGIDKNAKDFAVGLIDNWTTFIKLCDLLNCIKPEKKEYTKNILISGFRTNPQFEEICKRLNYNVMESGSKFDLLVVTPDRFNGKKAEQARKKGIPIMLLSEFISNFEL